MEIGRGQNSTPRAAPRHDTMKMMGPIIFVFIFFFKTKKYDFQLYY